MGSNARCNDMQWEEMEVCLDWDVSFLSPRGREDKGSERERGRLGQEDRKGKGEGTNEEGTKGRKVGRRGQGQRASVLFFFLFLLPASSFFTFFRPSISPSPSPSHLIPARLSVPLCPALSPSSSSFCSTCSFFSPLPCCIPARRQPVKQDL